MAEFPLRVLQIWRSRKRVTIEIQLMNIHVSERKYYCLHLVPKFGDVCDRQNWRLRPTVKPPWHIDKLNSLHCTYSVCGIRGLIIEAKWCKSIFVNEMDYGHLWFRKWHVAYSAPSNQLNQWWFMVKRITWNTLQWNFTKNTEILTAKRVRKLCL